MTSKKPYMSKYLLFVLLSFWSFNLFGQPVNDDCVNAINLSDVQNFCSPYGAYTTVNATPSPNPNPSCFSGAINDVWFRFVAIATEATVSVRGDDLGDSGGTLTSPSVATYVGNCGSLTEINCKDPILGINVVSAHVVGLIPGTTYYLRVDGANTGTFQLCVTNYNAPENPGQDCVVSAYLCDKSSFSVESVSGNGDNPDEVGGCLGTEIASTWYVWTAATSGSLTFTLTPINAPDDIDFILYELPGGIGSCGTKITLRCMGAGPYGPLAANCYGATGLRDESTDTNEPAGCFEGNDNWLKTLQMEAGKTYALMVSNFSDSGSGFNMEFGGTGTFVGPAADMSFSMEPVCNGQPLQISDASSGNIVDRNWLFGPNASQATGTGIGPFDIAFDQSGTQYITLELTSNTGCKVTKVKQIVVDSCCQTYNAIDVSWNASTLDCYYDTDGTIDLTVNTIAMPLSYSWDGGEETEDLTGQALGEHIATITNSVGCDMVLVTEIFSLPRMEFDTIITLPTCDGGTDGTLELPTTGGTPPYLYNFDGTGFGTANSWNNISNGLYTVVVKDGNDCIETLTDIKVSELELLLDPNVLEVDTPSCFGFTDGNIFLGVLNGQPPYQYDFGSGFTTNNELDNVGAGSYSVQVNDANLCKGFFVFDLVDHPAMTLSLMSDSVSCFGLVDGTAFAEPGGGVGPYGYLWNNLVNSKDNVNIPVGHYVVTVTDINGCTISDSTDIYQPTEVLIVNTGVVGVVCYGDSIGVAGVLAYNAVEPYLYAIDQGIFQQDTVFENLLGGWHIVQAQDADGCIGTDSLYIPQPDELIVHAFGDTSILLGYTTPLTTLVLPSGHLVDYQWIPGGDEFSFDTIPNPELRPRHSGDFVILITDEDGCQAMDTVFIKVVLQKPVYAPNIFSPNHDGVNDFFNLFAGPAGLEVNSLRVFNRWGAMVYEATDLPLNSPYRGWDGMIKGRIADEGVYVWYAEVAFWDGVPLIVSGDVTLVH